MAYGMATDLVSYLWHEGGRLEQGGRAGGRRRGASSSLMSRLSNGGKSVWRAAGGHGVMGVDCWSTSQAEEVDDEGGA